MKKKRWLAGVLAAVLLSGCGVRDYQIARAEAVLDNIFRGDADKEDRAAKESEETQEEISSGEAAGEEPGEAAAGGAADREQGEADETSTKEPEETPAQNKIMLSEAVKPPIETQATETQATETQITETQTTETQTTGIQQTETQTTETKKTEMQNAGAQEEVSYKTKYVINCKKSITLREAPSTSAAQLDEILWGEPVSFIKDDVNGFSKVAYLGKTGYVLAAYLGDRAPSADERPTSGNMEAVRVQFDYFIENGRECADVIGLDRQNQQVWKYEARSSHAMTELEAVQEIGTVGDSYYLNEDGIIVALAVKDGQVRWKNADFGGASVSFDIDEQGTLYLCGYYGPDLCVIDRLGNTIARIESFSPELQWPYEVRCEGTAVYVTCTLGGMDEVIVRYDRSTGEISY